MEEDQVREYINKQDTQKPMGPEGKHPRVLRDLDDVFVRSFLIIFDLSR